MSAPGIIPESLYGTFHHKGVGVICLVNGQIVYQIRNRKFKGAMLAELMKEIQFTHNTLIGKCEEEKDLFYFVVGG